MIFLRTCVTWTLVIWSLEYVQFKLVKQIKIRSQNLEDVMRGEPEKKRTCCFIQTKKGKEHAFRQRNHIPVANTCLSLSGEDS